jgi:hypothetical protein
MGLFDRLFGTDDSNQQPQRQAARSDDEIAVERYRYLLRTAPPETIEQVHAEAFSKLTQEQRDLLFAQLSENASEAPRDTSPAALASSATRQELRNPGTMERSFNGGGGMGFGGTLASSLLGTVAGYVIASSLVSAFMPNDAAGDSSADSADSGSDSADSGSDTGDSGGDFGGGDFGGDFGGGFDF